MRFEVRTSRREELVDVTKLVAEAVVRSGVRDGAALVSSAHTTAAVTVNENADPDVCRDLLDGLSAIAPLERAWRHREGNSDAHLKTSLVGFSAMVPVENGSLVLGTWQGIYLCEFDGPRVRRLDVTVLPGVR